MIPRRAGDSPSSSPLESHRLRNETVQGRPETRYALSGDVSIAYQELEGSGPIDVVFAHGFVGNLEIEAENPRHEAFFDRLGALGRVIRFDRRGTGLSDRVREVATLETRMDDLRAVMDAARSPRAILLASFEAASMAMVFAATYPERVAGLALYNPVAKGVRSPDYPWARYSEEECELWLEQIRTRWGTREYATEDLRDCAPAIADDAEMQEWWARVMRLGASPGAALVIIRMLAAVDVRDVLPSIRVPTLVLHTGATRGEATYIAERIPNARRVELQEAEALFWEAEGLADEVLEFASSAWGAAEPETVLATVLFTDIAGSTEKAGGARRSGLDGSPPTAPRDRPLAARSVPRGGPGTTGRVARLLDGQGSRGRIRLRVRGSRRARAQGRPRRMAPLCSRALRRYACCGWSARRRVTTRGVQPSASAAPTIATRPRIPEKRKASSVPPTSQSQPVIIPASAPVPLKA